MLRPHDALVWCLLASWTLCLRASAAPSVADAGTVGPRKGRALRGRFLHITDFHPDPHYKAYASTEENAACHRKHGPAGYYGAETSACDSPKALVNATLEWIRDHLADQVDFVLWTGDSARHDNDEKLPRTQREVVALNEFMVAGLANVFGTDGDPSHDFAVPIVPTFGNNDIMPHNILLAGPNKWTVKFLDIWRGFIPEEQRHQFQQGGWFFVEVIPNRLAVVSLNTLYFFSSNSGVDGCANKHEPGYEHFEWLRIQLQLFRERGMHAILIGHVPPARVDSKESWDETCWQKYALWERQYRDVIVASFFGHMNIDHFILQDFKHIKKNTKMGKMDVETAKNGDAVASLLDDGEVTVASASDYLLDLRRAWAALPSPPPKKKKNQPLSIGDYVDADEGEGRSWWHAIYSVFSKAGKGGKGKKPKSDKQKYLDKIGGKYAERYSVNIVSPSVVPNYFPTIRVFEYNITGMENMVVAPVHQPKQLSQPRLQKPLADSGMANDEDYLRYIKAVLKKKHEKKEKDALKKKRKYKFKVPKPPPKGSLPGPAYRPQPLTLTGYTQYFANLTHINNDFVEPSTENATHAVFGLDVDDQGVVEAGKWKEGKHHKHQGKKPRPKPHPKKFGFEVEYDTQTDKLYKLKDLTVRSYVDLAERIARVPKKKKNSAVAEGENSSDEYDIDCDDEYDGHGDNFSDKDEADLEVNKKKHMDKKRKHIRNPTWFAFVKRAFVGTMSTDEIEQVFGIRGEDETGVPLPEDVDIDEL